MPGEANSLRFPNLYEMSPPTAREIQIAASFAVLKAVDRSEKRRPFSDDVEQQRKRLARETAVLVHEEVEHWENSIRELEALLQQQQQSAVVVENRDGVPMDAIAPNNASLAVVEDDEEGEVISPTSFGISSSQPFDNIHSQ